MSEPGVEGTNNKTLALEDEVNNLRMAFTLIQEQNEALQQENESLKLKLQSQSDVMNENNTSVATAAAAAQLNNYQQALNLSEAQKQQVIAENEALKEKLEQLGITFAETMCDNDDDESYKSCLEYLDSSIMESLVDYSSPSKNKNDTDDKKCNCEEDMRLENITARIPKLLQGDYSAETEYGLARIEIDSGIYTPVSQKILMKDEHELMKYRDGVMIKNMNYTAGEIVSLNGSIYNVIIRGTSHEECVKVHKNDLVFRLKNETDEEEMVRQQLHCYFDSLNESNKNGSNLQAIIEIRNKILAFRLADEAHNLLQKYRKMSTVLPEGFQERILALSIEQYYLNDGNFFFEDTTRFYMIFEPFLKFKYFPDRKECEITNEGLPTTNYETFKWLQDMYSTAAPAKVVTLIIRAFMYASYHLRNIENKNLDHMRGYIILYCSIQAFRGLLTRNVQAGREEINKAMNIFFLKYGTIIPSHDGTKQMMTCAALQWCICSSFIKIGESMKNKLSPQDFEIFGQGEREILKYFFTTRQYHPSTYYQIYRILMSDRYMVSSPMNVLIKAFMYVKEGKKEAEANNDVIYLYIFTLIESFWIPSSLWPREDVVTYSMLKERLKRVKSYKKICQKLTPEIIIRSNDMMKHQLNDFLKVFKIKDDDMEISSIQFPAFAYCSCRFDTKLYKPGGKYDKFMSYHKCNLCSAQISKPFRCGRCLCVSYCNKECQKEDWKEHKIVCKPKDNKG